MKSFSVVSFGVMIALVTLKNFFFIQKFSEVVLNEANYFS